MPYKLPAKLVEYLKTGPLRLEFPERELVKWAELYPYMDLQKKLTWETEKVALPYGENGRFQRLFAAVESRDKKLWYLDIEHPGVSSVSQMGKILLIRKIS